MNAVSCKSNFLFYVFNQKTERNEIPINLESRKKIFFFYIKATDRKLSFRLIILNK